MNRTSMLRAANKTLLASAVVTCILATGSFAQADQQRRQKSVDTPLANLHFADGSSVEFHELAPGELIILAKHRARNQEGHSVDAINGVKIENLARLDAVEKYRALTGGRPAPARLIDAQNRSEQVKRRELEGNPRREAVLLPANDTVGMTARRGGRTAWKMLSCDTRWTSFDYCWTNRTGDGTVVEESENMDSTASPYRGDITHTVEYETCFLFICNWNVSRTQTLPQGWEGHIWASGPNRARRATIRNADGDGWNWHVGGGEELGVITIVN
ncbi:hypothetical protein [Benzoatithermus flavus]|uniref:Secreted protein n=1 Tax=Benzoatithermus flavus TaxID=3108223 RepID=A0ABU8XS17_9PROT